ncbi:MAG: hypothetical protein JWP89_4209 [Schlesneria sp.]|nr:hypothetical protein [Schlesneria sp.]
MRDHSVVIPAQAGIQKMDIGLPYSIPVHTIGRQSRELRCDRSLDSRLRGNDEHQTRLCHALSVPWLSALSPQSFHSVGCIVSLNVANLAKRLGEVHVPTNPNGQHPKVLATMATKTRLCHADPVSP